MLRRLAFKIHSVIERRFPEMRLFLKSDSDTRFLRLRPHTQLFIWAASALALGWTILATSIVLFNIVNAAPRQKQTLHQQNLFEERLRVLGEDRDKRLEEATRAQHRFNLALLQVAEMQARLLASEDRRRELETGVDVIQNTLRRTINERDQAKAKQTLESDNTHVTAQSKVVKGDKRARIAGMSETIDIMASALSKTAQERDNQTKAAQDAEKFKQEVLSEKRAMIARNDEIFSKLEEAVSISIEPLEKMFRSVGLSPENIIKQIQNSYSGQGGPLTPVETDEGTDDQTSYRESIRANTIIAELDRMNLYRLAAFRVPFAFPIDGDYRLTSGYGKRKDPINGQRRMHNGTDFAGRHKTPILATADGTINYAGWGTGYGRIVKIKHDFGIQTFYAHLSKINVKRGQKISRGEKIGEMGNSGRSTGTHLHYEVRVGKRAVDPMKFIGAAKYVF